MAACRITYLFSDAVLDMQVDDVVGPIVTGSTIHIIKLLDRRVRHRVSCANQRQPYFDSTSEIVTSEQALEKAQEIYQRIQGVRTSLSWRKSSQRIQRAP